MVALSDENGTALFDDDTDASQGHLSAKGRLEVAVARLDDIAKIENLPPPDVIKMDVEGAEAKVLAGGEGIISQFRPLIFLATHGAEVKQDCLKWLMAHGYGIEALSETDEESADPEEAVDCYVRTKIDTLVLGKAVVRKSVV